MLIIIDKKIFLFLSEILSKLLRLIKIIKKSYRN